MDFPLFIIGLVVFLVSMSFFVGCVSEHLETENAHRNSHPTSSEFSKHAEQTFVTELEDEEPPSYSQVV